ncbi:hypothetical protein BDD12DRAFT_869317 [Trichophaea hybrida]|nr:hypothetical protein BDD12DRAFT_869317 [Trichophaea hybrida]
MATVMQPNISLLDGASDGDHNSFDQLDDTSKPKSPSNRFTSFFRWGSTSEQGNGPESTLMAQGDRDMSPSLSPK